MKNYLFSLFAVLFLISCDNSENSINEEVAFDHYTIDEQRNYVAAPESNFHSFTTGNIIDGKRHSITYEEFDGTVSQGQATTQQYFYTGNLLTSVVKGTNVKNFVYDEQGRMIAAEQTSFPQLYYRYSYHENNVVYGERLTLPYTDAGTIATNRYIVQFDANDNIVKGGNDSNMDGIMDNVNNFTYENDDLVLTELSNGTTVTRTYSNVVDNFSVLDDTTYGKKNPRLLCIEHYTGSFFGTAANGNLWHSRHLMTEEFASGTFTVFDNEWFQTRSTSETLENPAGEHTTVTEFFVD